MLTNCMTEYLRAGAYNGNTTVNCEHRIIQLKKKLGKKFKTRYKMSRGGCDEMLPYFALMGGYASSVRLSH